jgi:RHS repeat-associated protein
MLRSSATSYFHADGLGSITSLSNAAGSIANTYAYDSYGNLTASTGSLVNSFRYTGRESDQETGLYYYRARYYDPNAGRFLGEDPLGSGGGINFYGYAGNNSPNLKDIFGLDYSTSRSGNTINVNASITLYGPGASDALAAQWQHAILDTWNNNIGSGKCAVKFNVLVIADPKAKDPKHASTPTGFPGANNYINVPEGTPDKVGNPFINPNRFTGTIPSGTGDNSVAHEFGHLLHLWDTNINGWHINPLRPNSDIMNEGWTVSDYDINRIIGGGKASTCGCQ